MKFYLFTIDLNIKKWMIQRQCYFGWNTSLDIYAREMTIFDDLKLNARSMDIFITMPPGEKQYHLRFNRTRENIHNEYYFMSVITTLEHVKWREGEK